MMHCKQHVLLIAGILCSTATWAQQHPAGTEAQEPAIQVSGMHFPTDHFGSQNNRAELSWQLDSDLSAAIALFHDTYGPFSERVRLEALLKRTLGSGFYLFTGVAAEREMNPAALKQGSNLGWMSGAGFAPNKNLSVEAGLMISVSKPQIGYFGTNSQNNSPFLRARFRY